MNYNFKKSICEKYEFKIIDELVLIIIDESLCLFQSYSKWGNYNFSSLNHNMKSFKHFLVKTCENQQFIKYIADDDYFYPSVTLDNWLNQIVKDRRKPNEVTLTLEEARDLWTIISNIEYGDAETCVNELLSHSLIWEKYKCPQKIFNAYINYSPSSLNFVKIVIPMFLNVLRNELSSKEDKI